MTLWLIGFMFTHGFVRREQDAQSLAHSIADFVGLFIFWPIWLGETVYEYLPPKKNEYVEPDNTPERDG